MALRGLDGWHEVHKNRFTHERWEELHHAMHNEADVLLYLNPFIDAALAQAIQAEYSLVESSVPGSYSFEMPEDNPSFQCRLEEHPQDDAFFVEVLEEDHGIQDPYVTGDDRIEDIEAMEKESRLSPFALLEGGTLLIARALGVEHGDNVLDVCGGPGSKALLLAGDLFGRSINSQRSTAGRLVVNEVSKQNASALQRVLHRYLPWSFFEAGHIILTSADIRTPSNSVERHGPYDRILLEAPSTNDRALLRGHPVEADRWSKGKLKVNHEQQVKMLHNALWMLKEGGILLYTVAALAQEECDDVIEAVVRKALGNFELEVLPAGEDILRMIPGIGAEQSHWGTYLLPDRTGFTPRYFARLRIRRRTHEGAQLKSET